MSQKQPERQLEGSDQAADVTLEPAAAKEAFRQIHAKYEQIVRKYLPELDKILEESGEDSARASIAYIDRVAAELKFQEEGRKLLGAVLPSREHFKTLSEAENDLAPQKSWVDWQMAQVDTLMSMFGQLAGLSEQQRKKQPPRRGPARDNGEGREHKPHRPAQQHQSSPQPPEWQPMQLQQQMQSAFKPLSLTSANEVAGWALKKRRGVTKLQKWVENQLKKPWFHRGRTNHIQAVRAALDAERTRVAGSDPDRARRAQECIAVIDAELAADAQRAGQRSDDFLNAHVLNEPENQEMFTYLEGLRDPTKRGPAARVWPPARMDDLKRAIAKQAEQASYGWWRGRRHYSHEYRLSPTERAALDSARRTIDAKKAHELKEEQRQLGAQEKQREKDKKRAERIANGEYRLTPDELNALGQAVHDGTKVPPRIVGTRPFTDDDFTDFFAIRGGIHGAMTSAQQQVNDVMLNREHRELLDRVALILRPVWEREEQERKAERKTRNQAWRGKQWGKVKQKFERPPAPPPPPPPTPDAPPTVEGTTLSPKEERFITELLVTKGVITREVAERYVRMFRRPNPADNGVPTPGDIEEEAADRLVRPRLEDYRFMNGRR